ncbi:MAG: heat-shock protein Hsp20 [Opitutus sp.]|nr:heat-shock protein Hsp20 [Opitutus sp.]
MYRLTRYAYPAPLFRARNPWSGLDAEIDRLFATALADAATPTAPRFPVDLYEDKDNTYVRAELPGVTRENVNLELVEGYLTLTANRKDGEQEFTLTRSIALPEDVQTDKVAASLEHGVLTVTLPKQEQAKPRKINISVS